MKSRLIRASSRIANNDVSLAMRLTFDQYGHIVCLNIVVLPTAAGAVCRPQGDAWTKT